MRNWEDEKLFRAKTALVAAEFKYSTRRGILIVSIPPEAGPFPWRRVQRRWVWRRHAFCSGRGIRKLEMSPPWSILRSQIQ